MAALKLVVPTPAKDIGHAALIEDLVSLLKRLDESFDMASTHLCQSVTRIQTITSALTEVTGMFDGGVGVEAVNGLRMAAESLRNVRSLVQGRSHEIATMHEAARSLRTSAGEVMRCLQVLDIYGMNVKITASGHPQFMEFADAMRGKLDQGDRELRGLDHMLEGLLESLREMGENDRLLDRECAKVFPQVPNALMREAGNLQQHQMRLGNLAKTIAGLALAIQTELHAAIQAMQIGDSVRQRLEHVLASLRMLETRRQDGSMAGSAGAPLLRVLAALFEAAVSDYGRDRAELAASLSRLQSQCRNLQGLDDDQASEGDSDMLERIEASVAEAHLMLRQLDRANSEGMATLDLILQTVDEVTERAEAITRLRLDVQHMAINIGLSCRTAQSIGRPVMVIANEIRTYSERLDAIADAIQRTQTNLSAPCHRLQSQSHKNGGASGKLLARFLTTIGDCNERGRQAMAVVEAESDQLGSSLALAIDALEEAGMLEAPMRNLSSVLQGAGSDCQPVDGDKAVLLQTMLDDLARSYTMADERLIHNQALVPGLNGIAIAPDVTLAPDDDEDDGLF